MKNLKQLINNLSDLVQILPYYYNYKGEKISIPLETKIEIISSMGIEITEESLIHWIEYFEQYQWKNLTEPVYVTGKPYQIFIYSEKNTNNSLEIEILPYEEIGYVGQKIHLTIDLSNSSLVERKTLGNEVYFKYCLALPELPIGYYKLKVLLKNKESESLLIIVPHESFTCFHNKTWGFHINLWSIRGKNIEGDFSHLKDLAQYINNLGGFVSINPLHFNDPEDTYGISPYSAISRQFKTPLYLPDIEIEEKNKEFFEYYKIWTEKMEKLRKKFKAPDENSEIRAFQEYKKNLPPLIREDLKCFAVFCFLREKIGKNWLTWEDRLKNPDKKTIDTIYLDNFREVLFYEYLQWLVDKELESLKNYNLCLDLGFGSIKSSFDVWINKEIYALNAQHGAPPDEFNPKGQKWGFPPIIPFKLKENRYLPFIKIVRANMKGKLLRIDHALGLFRAFWITDGRLPTEGAYIGYPWQDLLGIICLESQLNKTAVIGEDLGTAEEWMSRELINRKISSWRVFYFEKEDSAYKEQSQYPEEALCSITTHDLPTFKGFWYGKDIELRKKFSIFDESMFNQALKEREKDKEKILNLLSKFELIEDRENMENILFSIIRFLSGTKAKYLLLYPEDFLFIEEQTNLPGTTLEYPNWQRKLPITLEEFLNSPIIKKLETILKETGRIPEYL
ncbi:MAG: 4-alpha-glucanotransferase [Thermodesulfovibrio sp.]|nr:4-alpha-glucanotransferase [Thermodesulfovibrio sp.]